MKIAILTRTLVEGDAVGNDVIGQYVSLKKKHSVNLYAEYGRVQVPVNSINNLGNYHHDIIIYHHSIGWEDGVRNFTNTSSYKILKYHNITPPHFLEGKTQKLCEEGIKQLPDVVNQCSDIWVDSEYNGMELQSIKLVPFKIIPPYNQADILMQCRSDSESVSKFNDWNINIIMVGRIAPNKNIIAGLEGFNEFYKKNRHSRLFIVGDGIEEPYGQEVKQRIIDLGLPNVVLTGKVPIETLKALYLVSDVLLITSQHEGFCVPMVEAMALGIPVVSNDKCALPYTGKDAVYYATTSESITNGIDLVLNNKLNYIEKGRRLFTNYRNSSIEVLLLSAINSIQAK